MTVMEAFCPLGKITWKEFGTSTVSTDIPFADPEYNSIIYSKFHSPEVPLYCHGVLHVARQLVVIKASSGSKTTCRHTAQIRNKSQVSNPAHAQNGVPCNVHKVCLILYWGVLYHPEKQHIELCRAKVCPV